MSTSREIDFDLKLAEYRINGYVVFEGMLPLETVDRLYAAFLPLLEHVRQRDTEVSRVERGDVRTGQGRLQTTNRYTLTIPWTAPFADPEIYQHPVMLEFIERYWGDAEFILTCYHSNTPCIGSEYQPWHRDTRLAQEIPHVGLETCPTLSIKFPLVDTSEENGSFELLPSTQYLADPNLETRYDDLLRRGRFPSARRLNLKRGTMWVQDIRTLHRGTPNRSTRPRPELCLCFCRDWYAISHNVAMPQASYDALSERGKRLLQRCRIVEWDRVSRG